MLDVGSLKKTSLSLSLSLSSRGELVFANQRTFQPIYITTCYLILYDTLLLSHTILHGSSSVPVFVFVVVCVFIIVIVIAGYVCHRWVCVSSALKKAKAPTKNNSTNKLYKQKQKAMKTIDFTTDPTRFVGCT